MHVDDKANKMRSLKNYQAYKLLLFAGHAYKLQVAKLLEVIPVHDWTNSIYISTDRSVDMHRVDAINNSAT